MIKKKISIALTASIICSMVSSVQPMGAVNEKIISFGDTCLFDKFTLSYKDAQTAEVKIAFSEDGQNFGDYRIEKFSDDTEAEVYLPEAEAAKSAKLEMGNQGMPKVTLEKVERYKTTKDNVGRGTRGIDGNTKDMWTPGHANFAQWFDGVYDKNGVLTSLGAANAVSMYHDAVKDGRTGDISKAMIELNYTFNAKEEFAYAVIYMEKNDTADFQIRIPDKDGETVNDMKLEDYGEPSVINSENGNKTVYTIKAPIGRITDSFTIYWHNFHRTFVDGASGKENSMVNMPEMAFYYYDTVYESEFVLYDGAEYTFKKPMKFARIDAKLPQDMWYVGTTTNGKDVDFREKEGLTGYFAENSEEISKVRIRGYNAEKTAATKMPSALKLYGTVTDLAKDAYAADTTAVVIEGKAGDRDFGRDTRAEYMSVEKETGIPALFDGDIQYKSIHPYHIFVDADKDRLTLAADSSITVNLGKQAIVDTVSYYAGPQYTPKRYTVIISNTADFKGAKNLFEKNYELLEGRLSPFTTPDEYYCSMREDQNVQNAAGQYVKIVNDGVLKPESDRLVILDENGGEAMSTVMKNEAMLNKGVILAKELRIMGAPLVATVNTADKPDGIQINCKYNEDEIVHVGNNTVTVSVTNNTAKPLGKINAYIAVYDENGRLKSVKMDMVGAVAVQETANMVINNIKVVNGETLRVFVWDGEMSPLSTFGRTAVS